ncbi:MAG: hypothetical protein ACYTGG_10865 [Planctomycetota bacterium]|jgi:hypothetical protein
MLDAVKRNATLLVGMLLAAIVCVAVEPYLVGPRGAPGPTILQADSVALAVLAILVAMVLVTLIACVVGRCINTAVGLFVLGTGLYALAGRLATVEELVWSGGLGLLPVETLLWGIVVLAAVLLVFRVAGPLADIHPPETGHAPHWLISRDALISVAAGVAVIVCVWLFARSSMRGQTIGAVFAGAMVTGMAGRLLAPNVQPVLLFVMPCLFGAIGQAIGLTLIRGTPVTALVDNSLPTLIRPMPIDFAAAGLMGVSVGLGWARSFLHHEEDSAVAAPAGQT